MSYCRWSTDDFQCDLYCYESNNGFEIHVARKRVVITEELPPPVNPLEDMAGFFERHRKASAIIDRSERVAIGLAHDGESFLLNSAGECADKIEELVALGYRCPPFVVTNLREEHAREERDG